MSNIEDDIKEIRESIEEAYRCYDYDLDYNPFSKGIAEMMDNILSDYTRQKQINEEHQKINGELREQVKELEEENKENKKKYLALLIGQFPDTTETYKKYKKELQKLLQESEDK